MNNTTRALPRMSCTKTHAQVACFNSLNNLILHIEVFHKYYKCVRSLIPLRAWIIVLMSLMLSFTYYVSQNNTWAIVLMSWSRLFLQTNTVLLLYLLNCYRINVRPFVRYYYIVLETWAFVLMRHENHEANMTRACIDCSLFITLKRVVANISNTWAFVLMRIDYSVSRLKYYIIQLLILLLTLFVEIGEIKIVTLLNEEISRGYLNKL